MRTKASSEVAQVLTAHILARFGVPSEFRMDRGLEFAGEVTEMCNKYGIDRKVISV